MSKRKQIDAEKRKKINLFKRSVARALETRILSKSKYNHVALYACETLGVNIKEIAKFCKKSITDSKFMPCKLSVYPGLLLENFTPKESVFRYFYPSNNNPIIYLLPIETYGKEAYRKILNALDEANIQENFEEFSGGGEQSNSVYLGLLCVTVKVSPMLI